VTIYREIGQCYYALRDYTNAIDFYQQALQWERHHFVAHNMTGIAQIAMGDYLGAIAHFERGAILDGTDEAEARHDYGELRDAFIERGAPGYWELLWKRKQMKPNEGFYVKAIIQHQLGHNDEAFVWLNKSYESHEQIGAGCETWMNYLLWHHWWDDLHDDPRFKELLDKVGFTKVMSARK
jgi:tetratricopeptide (TPR) repeat protein